MKREIKDQNALYEMARLIAGQRSGDRSFRDDIISEAYLAVANGTATTKREVENAVRASLREEWSDEDRHVNLQISDSVARQGAPERARPDIWAAIGTLTERQRVVVVLKFWYGLTQGEIADIFGVDQGRISRATDDAIEAMKKFFMGAHKTPRKTAVGI